MAETIAPSAVDTIKATVTLFQKPESRLGAEDQLMTLLRMIELLNARGETFHRRALEEAGEHVDGLRDGLRSSLGALIGPLIGSCVPQAIRQINEQIQVHQDRIDMFTDADETDWGLIYDDLQASGLRIALDRQQFIEDSFERGLVRQGEDWMKGQLEYKQRELEELFERFVTKDENL